MANMIGELGDQMPVVNQEAAQQAEAARKIAQQSRIKQMSAGQAAIAGPQAAQQMGGAAAQQSAQIQTQAAKAAAQAAAQQAQLGLQRQALIDQDMQSQRESTQQKQFIERAESMSKFGGDVEDKIMTSRRDFNKAERDLGFGEERQLADWNIMNAQREEDFKNYAQEVQFQTDRNLLALDQAYNVFVQKEKQLLQAGESALNREAIKEIRAYKAALEKAKKDAKKKSAYTQKMVGVATIAAGAAITFFSSGTGAAVGAGLMTKGAGDVATADSQS